MGYIRHPSYYKKFKCIGSDCTDNCCIGWEIDIDENTLAYYQQISGTFGRKLQEKIALPASDSEGNAHFIMDSTERCPFLNDCNLCDIFIHLGEAHLSQICTDHPRFYEWFSDGREEGLGLCCEAAAKLILQNTGYPEWDISYDEETVEAASEDIRLLEQLLFSMRETLFSIIKPETDTPLDSKMNQLYQTALSMQKQYDDILFPFPEAEEPHAEDALNWSLLFWQEDFLSALLDSCLCLEINDAEWRDLLLAAKASLPEIICHRPAFLQYYQQKLYEYDQLLIYFIYRYFMKTLVDDLLLEKVNFALLSVSIIQLLDIFCWLRDDTLTAWQQLCLCKLYSKEIEYNTDNTDFLSGYAITE
ncbi:MAG: flagellin lysine-N-methylase [Clostridia bacterium]|nr:flagellin lysine-N-methylase [Clostridia bacterium]